MQIGKILLYDFEVPPRVTFGGQHRMVVHKTADGTRIIDALGPDDADIQFRGIFSGENAAFRARALDEMRLSGVPIWLTWSTFRYRVIIKSVRLDYRNQSWILYQATCLIVDQPGIPQNSRYFVQQQVFADIIQAVTSSAVAGVDISVLAQQLSANPGEPKGAIARSDIDNESRPILEKLTAIGDSSPYSATDNAMRQSSGRFGQIVSVAGAACNAIVAAAYLGRTIKSIQS